MNSSPEYMPGGKGISRRWFCAIVAFGLFLPFVAKFFVQLASGGWGDVFPIFPKVIESPAYIILGVLNAIPYVVLALMAKLLPEIQMSPSQTTWLKLKREQIIFRRRAGIVGAVVFMIACTCFINVAVWMSGSSTAAVAFVFLPFYGTISLLPGFLCGWVIGTIILLA